MFIVSIMEGAYMEPEDMNYKFTAILIIAICILAFFGGPAR
jgi:hypothetical protein